MANCSASNAGLPIEELLKDPSAELAGNIIACRKCPRLIEHCRNVAELRRRAYRDWEYWGLPVPSFGPLDAKLLILGLAPGAHGANRTGRVFTGDSSGDFLYPALYATGFASQPTSVSRDDGLQLIQARITCAVHCSPPDNQPLPLEIRACRHWLEQELALMHGLQVVVALGRIAFESYCALRGTTPGLSKLKFAHNALHDTGSAHVTSHKGPALISSYHPSQQNTSTGRLTEGMFRAVFERAREIVDRYR